MNTVCDKAGSIVGDEIADLTAADENQVNIERLFSRRLPREIHTLTDAADKQAPSQNT